MSKSDTFLRNLASKRKGYTDILPGKRKYNIMLNQEGTISSDNPRIKTGKQRREEKAALKRLSEQPSGFKTGGRATHGYGKAYLKGGRVK